MDPNGPKPKEALVKTLELAPRMGWYVAALVIALSGGAAPALAEVQVGVSVFGGYNSYGMEDVNDFIDAINDGLAGSGYEMDEISSGWGYGAGLRLRPSGTILLALDYERLTASSELSVFGGTAKLDAPANAFMGTVFYLFPSASRARIGVGAGLGYYTSSGSVGADSSGVGFELDMEGSGIGFHGLAAVDVGISPTVHLEGMAGYRLAETGDLEVAGETAYNADGEEAVLDWSGFMSRLGLTFYFGAGSPAP